MDKPKLRKYLVRAAKLIASLALLIVVIVYVDVETLYYKLTSVSIWIVLLAVAIAVMRSFVGALRWERLLDLKGIAIPYLSLVRYYFLGNFYNLLLPSALGGDSVRALSLARHTGNRKVAVTSIIVERVLGFTSICMLGLLGLAIGFNKFAESNVATLIIITTIFISLILVSLFNRKLAEKIIIFIERLPLGKLSLKFKSVHEDFLTYGLNKYRLLENFGISLVFQIIAILNVAILGHAIGIHISFTEYLLFVPVIWVIIMIPISISGIGLREGAFVYLFTLIGVDKESALLLGILDFSITVAVGLIGGALQLVSGVRFEKELSSN